MDMDEVLAAVVTQDRMTKVRKMVEFTIQLHGLKHVPFVLNTFVVLVALADTTVQEIT